MRASPKSTLLFWFKFACCCVAMHRELNNAFHIALSRRARVFTAHKLCIYRFQRRPPFSSNTSELDSIQWSCKFISRIPKQISTLLLRRTLVDIALVTFHVCESTWNSQLSLESTTAPRYLQAAAQKSWFLISCRAHDSWLVRPRSLHRSVISKSTKISLRLVS